MTRRAVAALGPLVALAALGAAGVAVAEPAATFSISDERPVRAQEVTFTADVACAEPATCTWSVDGDRFASGRVASLSFETVGSRFVTLTIDDGADETGPASSVTQAIEVVNRAPTASLASTASGLAVAFDATVADADGDPLSYAWDFGDGAASSEADPSHVYAAAGSYVVKLTVADSYESTTVTETVTAAAAVEVGDPAPVGTVTASSTAPLTGEDVVLEVRAEDSDGGPLIYGWDVDGDGFDDGTDTSVGPLRFDVPGIRPVRVRITDDEGSETIASLDLIVGNRPPTAAFAWSPGVVTKGVPVTFNSRAADPEGQELAEQSWDLDGDGEYDDAFGSTASHTFRSAGRHEVGLRVVDAAGSAAVVRLPLVLGNRPPSARFAFEPAAPRSGDVLKLQSSASDEDGRVTGLAWDLDGDSAFDDAEGPIAERRVYRAGRLRIGLKAIDDDGGEAVSYREIDVAQASGRPAGVSPRPRPKLIQPFPTVRIAGRLTRTGAVFRLVTVRAPRGTRITWNCSGRRCRTGHRAGGGLVRLPALQRPFRTGTVIEIRVTRRGRIGKYTRVHVRRTGAPVRRDLCLPSGGKPRSCSR